MDSTRKASSEDSAHYDGSETYTICKYRLFCCSYESVERQEVQSG